MKPSNGELIAWTILASTGLAMFLHAIQSDWLAHLLGVN